jgi:hypothetical protein
MQDEDMSDLSKVCGRLGDGAASYVSGARLIDLAPYWLELHCCHGSTLIPFRLLAQRRGQEKLRDTLPRLRCKTCGKPPATAYLNETHHRTDVHGAPPGWSVQLIPAPAVITGDAG